MWYHRTSKLSVISAIAITAGCGINDIGLPNAVDAGPPDGIDSGAADGGAADAGPQDAGPIDTDSDTGAGISCPNGVVLWEICWVYGQNDQNCVEVCQANGDYHPDTPLYIGTETQTGDSDGDARCAEIVEALGFGERVWTGYRDDEFGVGCHRWHDDDNHFWWIGSPDFDPNAKTERASLFCGCKGHRIFGDLSGVPTEN